ncbi:hypothetical protein [Cellulomonas sp. PhB150]|uniref:hypothetical protein n=1 Tax=Cellulomonas sp. PhB150 TaxID=2485188 RepID=UPI000FA338A2|nr:hypothetical protein [Cellulomonas sp. PhB150]ROS30997.1 hypothetical protein EDF34_0648 [Cellulomonas sp. PhB150]
MVAQTPPPIETSTTAAKPPPGVATARSMARTAARPTAARPSKPRQSRTTTPGATRLPTPAVVDVRDQDRQPDDAEPARWWKHGEHVGPWQVEVRHRVEDISAQVSLLQPRPRSAVERHLATARHASMAPFPRWQWWNGTSIETAWNATHLAQATLPLVVGRDALPRQLVDARRRTIMRLTKGDPLRLAVEEPELGERVAAHTATAEDRQAIAAALQASLELADDEHRNLRDWRNRLLRVAMLAALALALTIVAAALRPEYLPLCGPAGGGATLCPGGGATATSRDAGVVAFLGALGGALAAIIAMRRASPGSSPYRITPALSLVRVPLGGLTAVVGVMLVQSGEVPGVSLTSASQVAVFALLFGFSQELVTRLLESRARVVQDATKGRSSSADRQDVSPRAA